MPTDAILILLDVVGYTPQARRAGGPATQQFDAHLKRELTRRAKSCGAHFIKPIGDAALLWTDSPEKLVRLICTLYHDDPIQPMLAAEKPHSICPTLRMLAHKDYFTFSHNRRGDVIDVHGLEAIVLFRLEKNAHINRVVVTPHLFGGMRHAMGESQIEYQTTDLPELKGVGADSPRQVYILIPPLAESVHDEELPAGYRQARAVLKESVQTIPVFGRLYDPIPMRENFLNLTLDRHRTQGRAGYYQWEAPDLERRLGVEGTYWVVDHNEASPYPRQSAHAIDQSSTVAHGELFPLVSAGISRGLVQRSTTDQLTADGLYERFPTAVIAGLPGAGKTTILRHFAWQAFERNPHATVVLVEARHLRPSHIAPPTTKGRVKRKATFDPLSNEHVFHVLANLFLLPGSDPTELSDGEKAIVEETAAALEREWLDRRLILLLDALDEAPTDETKQWLAGLANRFMGELVSSTDTEEKSQRPVPSGRCYLSLRAAELGRPQAVSITTAPVFVVNSLTADQIRAIARRRLKEDSALYARFDDQIWRRRDIQKVAGTPLTAMLMVFFFEVHGRFDRRFATYWLLVLFVLDRAWLKIKTSQFAGDGQGLNPFFHDIVRDDFFDRRPGLELQLRALAYVAREVLYHSVETRREIHRGELQTLLENGIRQLSHSRESKAAEPVAEWITTWERENLLLPVGPKEVVFLHSTVLEFLAALDVQRLLDRRHGPKNQLARIFLDRSRDHIETLPILCSHGVQLAWKVMKRLGDASSRPGRRNRNKNAIGEFTADATLPSRCLAETEACEAEYVGEVNNESLRRQREREVA